jgi:LPXTG-motif cell wall-anchored protein
MRACPLPLSHSDDAPISSTSETERGTQNVKSSQPRSWKSRAAALGLGLALAAGFSVTAAPAHAVSAATDTYSVSGTVGSTDENGVMQLLSGASVSAADGQLQAFTDETGEFTLIGLADGAYDLKVEVIEPTGVYAPQSVPILIEGADLQMDFDLRRYPVTAPEPTEPELPSVPAGTVTISGDLVVGSVLTATVAGWPADVSLAYEWGYSGGQFGGGIDGATSSSYTVTNAELGMYMVALVTASAEGFEPTTVSAFTETVVTSAPVKAAAAAPVSNSTQLAAYLAAEGVVTQPQASVGLPAGALNPTASYSAKLTWTATTDSFVDVYLYSTPTFVGTFAVVDGVAQINLSAKLLSQLAAGEHTLVAKGQTSGSVQSVAVKIAAALAETGTDAASPLTAAAFLLLLGGALVVARRRNVHA